MVIEKHRHLTKRFCYQNNVILGKVQQLAEITPNLPLTEYDFYEFFRTTFETSELGKMKRLLPLRKMADNLGLVRRGTMPRRGSRPYFTAEGKVALITRGQG